MFDRHLNGSHRLSYYAHGPEWAFVIPHGDHDALREVVMTCSRAWNGAGALILPADPDGRLDQEWERYRSTRPLDEVWLHPALGETAKQAVRAQTGPKTYALDTSPLRALHPSQLLEPAANPSLRPQMAVPNYADLSLRRVTNIAWGMLERPEAWEACFAPARADGDHAHLALLDGQLGVTMVSPLRVSQVSMWIFGAWDPQPWPYLWIFEDGNFDELVAFWNFRSGADANNDLASVIGLPQQALAVPGMLASLRTWAEAATGLPRSPQLLVHASEARLAAVEEALSQIGLDRAADGQRHSRVDVPDESARPTWLPWEVIANGRIVRGAHDSTTFTVENGRALVTLPRPRGYRPRGGARLVMQTLPTPLPITDGAASRMSHGAYAHPRGLAINMGSGSPWELSVQLPDANTALADWAADHGYEVRESPPSKDARALLQRLGDLDRLDALVDELALELLVTLTPTSNEQLVAKLAAKFAPPDERSLLAEELALQLRREGLLLELDARTIEQLQSAIAQSQHEVPGLAALHPTRQQLVTVLAALVDLGLVQRGRNVECPRCRYPMFLALRELEEHVRCRGCTLEFLLSVAGADGEEAKLAYRIDGLMARVVARHNLPVLLALRALRDPSRLKLPEHVWPGVLFTEQGENEFDIDLLASDGSDVYAAECKLDARGLHMPQLDRMLAFCDRVGAIPVVASIAGEFTAEIAREIETRDGVVLEREQLLTIGEAPTFS